MVKQQRFLLLAACVWMCSAAPSCRHSGYFVDAFLEEWTPTAPAFDCSSVPNEPESERVLDGPRAYHGIVFDYEGNIIGSDGDALIKSDYEGNWDVFVPGLGTLEQIDHLENGDIIAAQVSSTALVRITPDGGQAILASDIGAYGVLVGPDDKVYWASSGQIGRTDPGTGDTTILIEWPFGDRAHSLNFSPDLSRMYIGSIGSGNVYSIDLDKDLNPTGDPQVFSDTVGNGGAGGNGWHDGVGVDACGYLYVPDFWGSHLYRISPDGEAEIYVDWSADSNQYGHGAVFGEGVGGWREDAIYLPMPYGDRMVKELVVGAPSREAARRVLNPP